MNYVANAIPRESLASAGPPDRRSLTHFQAPNNKIYSNLSQTRLDPALPSFGLFRSGAWIHSIMHSATPARRAEWGTQTFFYSYYPLLTYQNSRRPAVLSRSKVSAESFPSMEGMPHSICHHVIGSHDRLSYEHPCASFPEIAGKYRILL